MIELFNEYGVMKSVAVVVGVFLFTGIIGWFVWSLLRIKDRDNSIIKQYHKKRDPQIKSLVRAIMSTCKYYTQDAPYVMKHFYQVIENEMDHGQLVVMRSDGFPQMSNNFFTMLQIAEGASSRDSKAMDHIIHAENLLVAAYESKFEKVGNFTDVYYSKTHDLLKALSEAENRLINRLEYLQEKAEEGTGIPQSREEVQEITNIPIMKDEVGDVITDLTFKEGPGK